MPRNRWDEGDWKFAVMRCKDELTAKVLMKELARGHVNRQRGQAKLRKFKDSGSAASSLKGHVSQRPRARAPRINLGHFI